MFAEVKVIEGGQLIKVEKMKLKMLEKNYQVRPILKQKPTNNFAMFLV